MYERNSGLKFFSRFLGPSPPVLAENNAGKRFLNFFFYFFQNFHARVKFEPNSGLKFFFFSLSRPISFRFAQNNAGMRFFNFMNFFSIVFGNFLAGVEYERNSGL